MKQGWSSAGSRAIYHRLGRLDLELGQRLFEYLDCVADVQLCLAPVVLRLLQFSHAFLAGLVFGLEGDEVGSESLMGRARKLNDTSKTGDRHVGRRCVTIASILPSESKRFRLLVRSHGSM